ncbi:Fanconi anemia group J protein homolog isoform X1 [Bemisia tabaci]|uniref:Fanconi anemia group J protein homolog isoform X1 n=1 Tax=Bemisia tabaci TaxID=7038 RepID=UPI003B287A01
MSLLDNIKSFLGFSTPKFDGSCSNPDMESHTYTIGGVVVHFPHKAYGAQVAIMDKVIRGCNSSRNCLVESPTGSGKTLALLCSALAWQGVQKEKIRRENEQLQADYLERLEIAERKLAESANQAPQNNVCTTAAQNNVISNGKSECCTNNTKEVVELSDDDLEEDADVFKSPQKKKVKIASPTEIMCDKQCLNDTSGTNQESKEDSAAAAFNAVQNQCADEVSVPKPKFTRPPKIYFGTRTHKQIEQIIKELKKTAYKDTRMTILSSREHTCINNMDTEFQMRKKQRQWRNKTELCKDLLDPRQGMGCMYKVNVERINAHRKLENDYSFPNVWDIEDFVNLGKAKKACPYFAARDIAVTADIIFCPYNYLIHPLIRKSMEINLKGEIMILDEAHNIEDVCRDSASLTVHLNDLTSFMQECEKAAESGNFPEEHAQMRSFVKLLVDWIKDNTEKVQHLDDFNSGHAVWNGTQILASFENAGITLEEFDLFRASANEINKPIDPKEVNPSHISVSSTSKSISDGLSETLPYIFNEVTRNSFRVLLDKKMDSNFSNEFEEPEADSSGWVGRAERRGRNFTTSWKYSLNIYCLHPAVAFKEINESLRSVILTSGTLSPIESFQSELGAEFPIRLEAAHVIDKSQVWIGALSCGPRRIQLESTYQKTATYEFQDELGRVILEVCKKVPFGVLCFLSSYTLLEKLVNRWESTGLLDEISEHKYILIEPRRMDHLQTVMEKFYEYVQEKGALFFAVFRGKVSEGINFSDNYARCVISVGIPYPNAKDNLVKLKKDFNNEFRLKNNDILSGDKWYQIQAYRALNQALGRCIRHKNDWGAILLIDHRFSRKQNVEGLSKWIKNMIGYYPEWNGMIQSITNFTDAQIKRTSVNSETSTEIVCVE